MVRTGARRPAGDRDHGGGDSALAFSLAGAVAEGCRAVDSTSAVVVVRPTESIAEALGRAQPGAQVVVEPGEYRERLVLKDGVRVISRVPRGATIRLPGAASEADPAVVATDVSNAEFAGFRIVGDAATPLGTGVLVKGGACRLWTWKSAAPSPWPSTSIRWLEEA